MQDGTLLLGPVLFQDFEVPDSIRWGGAQRVVIHRLPGGARVIDALGRDDAEIAWSGVCSGDDAAARARLLDTMRAGGGVWSLSWEAFFYSVVITKFQADYAKQNWVPYQITCTVLQDGAEAATDAVVSLADDVMNDLVTAAAIGSPVDLTVTTTALGVTGATTAGTAAYTTALATLGAASTQMDASVGQAEASVAVAADPGTAADAAGTLAALTNARGFVQRAAVNLANASS